MTDMYIGLEEIYISRGLGHGNDEDNKAKEQI